MRLHIGVIRAKQLLRAVNRQLFHLVGHFAAAVVALPRITLRIFVREDRAHRLQHRFGHQIFRGNQLQSGSLAHGLLAQQIRNLRIHLVEGPLHPGVRFSRLGHLIPSAKCSAELSRFLRSDLVGQPCAFSFVAQSFLAVHGVSIAEFAHTPHAPQA